jgi:hypothetical protein
VATTYPSDGEEIRVGRGVVKPADQDSNRHWRNKEIEGVRSLAMGILLQAMRDATSIGLKSDGGWRDDAREWFAATGDSPGSLEWICEILELDADNLRHWIETRLREGHSWHSSGSRRAGRAIPHGIALAPRPLPQRRVGRPTSENPLRGGIAESAPQGWTNTR